MKSITIKKDLARQTTITLIIIGCFGGGAFGLQSLDDYYAEQVVVTKNQGDNAASQASELLAQYDIATSSVNKYQNIMDNVGSGKFTVSRDVLSNKINEIRKKYNFAGFDINMSDIKPIDGDQYKTKSITTDTSGLTIKLDAMSDADVFAMVKDLQESFSAFKINSFTINSKKELNNSDLIQIKNSCFAPLVSANISASWYGWHETKSISVDPAMDNKK